MPAVREWSLKSNNFFNDELRLDMSQRVLQQHWQLSGLCCSLHPVLPILNLIDCHLRCLRLWVPPAQRTVPHCLSRRLPRLWVDLPALR